MEETKLFKLALITSLIGLLILIIIAEKITLPNSSITETKGLPIDSYAKVQGKITNIIETPGLLILELQDNSDNIKVIVFKPIDVNLTKDQNIEVEGRVTQYKDEKEIQADLIKII